VVVGIGMVLAGLVLIATSIIFDGETVTDVATPTTTVGPYGPTMSPGTTAPLVDGGIGLGTAPERDGRAPLGGFGEVQATIRAPDGEVCEVCLLSATTAEQRERGLMEVTDPDLGGYDGMLFRFASEVGGGFYMRNTPLPLEIAYLSVSGAVVAIREMEPCDDVDGCPTYPPGGDYVRTIEVPVAAGGVGALGITDDADVVVVDTGRTCPA
jgi:uncharacterized protein